MKLPDYTYRQLIELDTTCGGLTRKQAVLSRQLDRRFKESAKRVMAGTHSLCRIDQRTQADLYDFLSDTPPY
jgi:transcriptional regulator GlxA family with amidase domain